MWITTDYKLAAGHNNAAGLVAITSITDGTHAFVEPFGIGNFTRGIPRSRCNGTRGFAGAQASAWVFSFITLAQWNTLKTTYEGLVTVRLALGTTTFANYNASLILPDISELTFTINDSIGMGGFSNVRVDLTRLVAI
jgi:hypothetical protein